MRLWGKNITIVNAMDELQVLLQDHLNIEFRRAVLSNPKRKEEAEKIKVRPLLQKGKLIFQIETFCSHQAFHWGSVCPDYGSDGEYAADADGDIEFPLYRTGEQEGKGDDKEEGF